MSSLVLLPAPSKSGIKSSTKVIMKHSLLSLFSFVSLLLLSACASSSSGKNADGTPKDEQSVNSLPWNKPASWEGGSGIPGGGGK
jgi:hypothetical protein